MLDVFLIFATYIVSAALAIFVVIGMVFFAAFYYTTACIAYLVQAVKNIVR